MYYFVLFIFKEALNALILNVLKAIINFKGKNADLYADARLFFHLLIVLIPNIV